MELIAPLNCTVPQKVNSLKGQVRYFLHQDNPEKAQYLKADLKYYGGFDPDLYLGMSLSWSGDTQHGTCQSAIISSPFSGKDSG